MESDQLSTVVKSVRDLAVVVFGFQLTTVGLFDGSSFLLIVVGCFVSVAGLLGNLTQSG